MRSICHECREFYCQNCSDYHLRFKATGDHHLIDLHPKYGDPQTATKESADEAELSSDFVEQLTVTENTVLYRAQVAVDREKRKNDRTRARGYHDARWQYREEDRIF